MQITKSLLDAIVEAEYESQTYAEDEPKRPVLGEPCSEGELHLLETALQKSNLPLPPSYREFLALANGIDGFKSNFSLVPVSVVLTPPHRGIQRGYPALAKFVVGRGGSLEFLAFDTNNQGSEELPLVWVSDDGEESRYEGFGEYLSTRLQRLQKTVARERSDRKDLKK